MQSRAIKLTAFCLLTICLQVYGNSYAQKVTLSVHEAPLQKVFREITRQTGVSIVYKEALLEGMAPVSVQVKDASIEETLQACLKGQPLSFALIGKSIDFARASGCRRVAVETMSPRDDSAEYAVARRFYAAMGFVPFVEFEPNPGDWMMWMLREL